MSFSVTDDTGDPVAEINVIPLVDIMLVMLVIFMITAPILQQGVEVRLPKATTAPLAGKSEQVVLSIDSLGKVFLGAGNEVEIPSLSQKIKAIMNQRKEEDRKVYIRADEGVSYGVIMSVMSQVHQAGILQIGLVSEPELKNSKKS